MKSTNPFLLTFLSFYITISAYAQPQYPEWKQYLSTSNVGCIKLDGSTLYTATNHFGSGLIALDLNTKETEVFSVYSAGIANDNINAMDVDADGNIWLGHYGYGISKLSDNICTIYNIENSGLINDSILTLCVDLNGKIWIGTWRGISSFDGQDWETFTQNNSDLPRDTVRVIVADDDNNKWIGFKGGFAIFDDTNWEIHNVYYGGIVENIAIDANGTGWIDAGALYKFDGDTVEYMNWPPAPYNYISDMDFDSEGNMWISIWSGMNSLGLAMYDGTEFIEYDFTEMNGYLDNHNSSLVIDANDNKWIGTSEDGLVKYNEGSIEQFNEGIYSLHGTPGDIAIENNNRVWMTTYHGLTEYNSGDWNYYASYNSDYPSGYSTCIAIDKNNKKWIGAKDKLITYDDENWNVYDTSNFPISIGYEYLDNIVIDKYNNKWFSKDGLYKFDNETWSYYNTENSAIPSENIYCMATDSNGVIWMGLWGYGVCSFDGDNWNLYDTTIAGPQVYITRSIYVDSINTKWICTETGLLSFDGDSWTVYDSSNTDLPSNSIQDCLFDNTGNLWVGTRNGIGIFDGIEWIIYDSTNSSLKYNYIRGLYKSENNTIWITVGGGGLSVYNENGFLTVAEPNHKPESDVRLSGYPNPFIFETNICFKTPESLNGDLFIYNLMGQKIKTLHHGFINSGENNFIWDGTNDNGNSVENGIYFCQLNSTKPIGTCKIVLMR